MIHTHTHTRARARLPYYLAIKKNLPFETMWLDLEGMMLSEISQTEESKHRMISLTYGLQKTKQMNK